MKRLDKALADLGAGSRAAVKTLIRRGQVTVDGEVVRDPKTKVSDTSAFTVMGEALTALPVLGVFHKPAGVHCTLRDQWGRPALDTALPADWREHHAVGRLDAETTGLLLLSTDGQFTQWVLHPKRAIEREYVALVGGEKVTQATVERLAAGVETSLGTFCAEVVEFSDFSVRLIVREGKNRMVRRLLNNVGHPVLKLHRLRYGAFTLGELPAGQARAATADELAWVDASR